MGPWQAAPQSHEKAGRSAKAALHSPAGHHPALGVPAANTRARKRPLRGERLFPSTEIFGRERVRASQRTRRVDARLVTREAVSSR
jgi:hypothetical protein